MKKYIVYLSTGERVCVEADDFDVDYNKHRVRFIVKEGSETRNIAIFNFTNIQGFCRGYTSEEKEQKYD